MSENRRQRITDKQKKLSEQVKRLIEIFKIEARIEEFRTWWQVESITLLAKVIELDYGPCQYNSDPRILVVNGYDHQKSLEISISEPERRWFLFLMAKLDSAAENKEFIHFFLRGIQEISSFEIPESSEPLKFTNLTKELIPCLSEKEKKAFYTSLVNAGLASIYDNDIDMALYKAIEDDNLIIEGMDPMVRKELNDAMESGKSVSFLKRQAPKSKIQIKSNTQTKYSLMPFTDLGIQLLEPTPKLMNQQNVTTFSWSNTRSIVEVIKRIMVNFHIEFGGYHRIKSCQWCNTLLYEDRVGRKKYCSNECKKKDQQDIDLRRCIDRQNKWLDRTIARNRSLLTENDIIRNHYSRMGMAICENCDKWKTEKVKGGECPEAIARNKDLLE